jgi:murein DD-endopeptidase MepM/ murein hydrolase activator NlpD
LRIRIAVATAVLAAFTLAASAPAAYIDPVTPPRLERAQPETFATPLRGPLHSRFGERWGRVHSGIDIAVLGTDRVRAALGGVVTAVGYLPGYSGYGNTVRIRHDRDLTTMYAHLAGASVRVGERVERGQRIGTAGCTGSCTGPHLHFEVKLRGKVVDPLPFLRGKLRYNRRAAGG